MNHAGRYAEAIGRRTIQFNGMTPRELDIYLSGQEDGANIKADEVQPRLSALEIQVHGMPEAEQGFPDVVTIS
jgi:hypothetical protein